MNSITNKPLKLYVLYCSNSLNIDEFQSMFPQEGGDEIRSISLPCSGKANLPYFLKAFESGADGLVLVTCAKNECRYLEGNLRAPKRAEQVGLLLKEIGMDGDRIAVINMNEKGTGAIVAGVTEFRNRVRNLSPNPSKGRDVRISAGVS